MKKIVIAVLVAAFLALASVGGWWVVSESGWVAWMPTSPHPKNLAAAIDRYLIPDTRTRYSRCLSIDFYPGAPVVRRIHAFEDAKFDYSPAGFRIVSDPNIASSFDAVIPKLRYLAKQGLLDAKTLADGKTEYTMTWKGFAGSNESGCFEIIQGRPNAKVLRWEKRQRDGLTIYEVEASVAPGERRPWVNEKEIAEAFGQKVADSLEPRRVQYDLARHAGAFTVIAEKGQEIQSGNRQDPTVVAINAKRAGSLDAEKIKTMLQSQLDGVSAPQARMCLPVPSSSEVDETDFYTSVVADGRTQTKRSAYFTFYNLLEQPLESRAGALKGYVALRKLEELGLAKSEQVPATEFKGAPAAGAVRFTVEGELTEALLNSPGRCLIVGKLVVDEIVAFEQIEEWRTAVRFWAKLKIVPVGDVGEKALKLYGHFRRMSEMGLGLRHNIQISSNGLRLYGAPIQQVAFDPDVSKISLPVVVGEKVVVIEDRARTERPVQVVLQQVMNMSRISKDGLTMTYGGAGAFNVAVSSVTRGRGKWYAEATLKVRPGARGPDTWTNVGVARKPASDVDFLTFSVPSARAVQPRSGGQSSVNDGETVGIAFDADTGRAYFYFGGKWMQGAPGDRNAGVLITKSVEYVIFAASSSSSGTVMGSDSWTFNFGRSRFKYAIPPGYFSYDGRLSASKAGAAAVPGRPSNPAAQASSQPAGINGAMNRCRNSAGKIEYFDKPCSMVGMEQLGIVDRSDKKRPLTGLDSGGDRIIWIDPKTGNVQNIPITSDNVHTSR